MYRQMADKIRRAFTNEGAGEEENGRPPLQKKKDTIQILLTYTQDQQETKK